MGRDKIHGNEPLLKRQLGVLKDCTCGAGEVMLAVVASKTPVSTSYAMVLSAMWTYDIVTTTNLNKCLLANDLIVEMINDRND